MVDRRKINIDREKEMRTKDISNMISEGGLGADNYYNIVKHSSSEIDMVSEKKDNAN